MTANKETKEKVAKAIKKLEEAKKNIELAVWMGLDDALGSIHEADELLDEHPINTDPNFCETTAWIGNVDAEQAIIDIDWLIGHIKKFYN